MRERVRERVSESERERANTHTHTYMTKFGRTLPLHFLLGTVSYEKIPGPKTPKNTNFRHPSTGCR